MSLSRKWSFSPTAVVATAAGTIASLGLNLFGAFSLNNQRHQTQLTQDMINNNNSTDSILKSLSHIEDLEYRDSRILGIAPNAIIGAALLPYIYDTIKNMQSTGNWKAARFYLENWDYVIGRALQIGGVALYGVAINENGAKNPQNAIVYTSCGNAAEIIGTGLVYRHNKRNQGQMFQVNANYNPLPNDNASAPGEGNNNSNASAPSYIPPQNRSIL